MSEFEIIQYTQTPGINLFFDTMHYRTAHIHPEWEVLWVLDAPLSITCARQDYLAPADSLVVISPRLAHQYRAQGDGSTFLCVQISSKCFDLAFPQLDHTVIDGIFPDRCWSPREGRQARALLLEMAEQYLGQSPCYPLFCQASAARLLAMLLSAMPTAQVGQGEREDQERRNARLMRLLAFVDAHYTEKLRLTDFARQEHCSVSYLSRFVREMLNTTFQNYVDTVRFNAACKHIAAGETRLVEVYAASGFSDYRYFCRAFRSRTGMSPEEYRDRRPAVQPPLTHIHQSIHSLEQFYTRERCASLLEQVRRQWEGGQIVLDLNAEV